MIHSRNGSRARSRRSGTSMIEVVVSAGILLVVMSFVASLTFRINLVWKDIGQHRAAMNELSNQLERLTLLADDDLAAAIALLEPSAVISQTLPEPALAGELIKDDWGNRLVLKLDWQRPHPAKPVQLVAWLPTHSDASARTEP